MKNVAHSVVRVFSEVKLELSRIEWPSFNEFIGSTVVVLIIVSAFALYLSLIDLGLSALMTKIFVYGAA